MIPLPLGQMTKRQIIAFFLAWLLANFLMFNVRAAAPGPAGTTTPVKKQKGRSAGDIQAEFVYYPNCEEYTWRSLFGDDWAWYRYWFSSCPGDMP